MFVNKFVVNSNAIKESTIKVEKIKEDKIMVIYNGVENLDMAREMAEYGYETVKNKFSVEKMIKEYTNLYEEIAK